MKENIKTIENALGKVSQLRGVEFDYKETGKHSLGFIAQEVEQIIPELVFGDDPKSVAYQNFVALLVEAIKELKEEVSSLKEELNNLKGNN
jgi:archaellum component FlaC